MRYKSKELMDCIIQFVDSEYSNLGRVPTQQQIADKFNITKQSVGQYLKVMANNGLIKLNSGSRGILTEKMQKSNNEILNIPVVGSVACGTPLLAEQNIDRYISIPKSLVGHGNFFILVASGDSMINANISNGDLVIVRQQETAEQGQIIVALLENEATLKRYYLEKGKKRVRLHPENDNMEDMFFDNVVIQGVAVKVIKDLV